MSTRKIKLVYPNQTLEIATIEPHEDFEEVAARIVGALMHREARKGYGFRFEERDGDLHVIVQTRLHNVVTTKKVA